MNVRKRGNNADVTCSPNGSYRLLVVQNGQLRNTYRSNSGNFNVPIGRGTYQLGCLMDGESQVRPACQQTVSNESNVCHLNVSKKFGGAPLRSRISCDAPSGADCRIDIVKGGRRLHTINGCTGTVNLSAKGTYEAICHVEGIPDDVSCRTQLRVSIMTEPPTGPMLPIIITLSLLAASGVVFYRRKFSK
jgi:hypothetical protein